MRRTQSPNPGQLSSQFRINDDNPEASIPPDSVKNKNPLEFGYLIEDLLARAAAAKEQKRYAQLVQYDRALVLAVPDRAKSWSELCKAYKLVNNRERAMRSCKFATERGGAELQDFVGYVELALMKPEALTPVEAADLRAVVEHLDKEGSGVVANHLRCEVGVKLHDVKMLETCTTALAKVAPNDVKTVVFQWNLAVEKGARADAARLLGRAKELGLPDDNFERMLKFTPPARFRLEQWILAVVMLTATAFVALWFNRRRRSSPSRSPLKPVGHEHSSRSRGRSWALPSPGSPRRSAFVGWFGVVAGGFGNPPRVPAANDG